MLRRATRCSDRDDHGDFEVRFGVAEGLASRMATARPDALVERQALKYEIVVVHRELEVAAQHVHNEFALPEQVHGKTASGM